MKKIEGTTGIVTISEVLYKDNPQVIITEVVSLVNEIRKKESLPMIKCDTSLHQTVESGIAIRLSVPGYRKQIGPENEKERS
jgi:hypothetical protein